MVERLQDAQNPEREGVEGEGLDGGEGCQEPSPYSLLSAARLLKSHSFCYQKYCNYLLPDRFC
jgi:hypothetical protein